MGILANLLNSLKNGEVVFEFRTSTGKIRKARGTLNQNRIPKEDWSKGKQQRQLAPKTDEMSVRMKTFQPFYDLDLGEWRRFKVFNVLKVYSSRNANDIKPEEIDLD